jgi:hypothetical protein
MCLDVILGLFGVCRNDAPYPEERRDLHDEHDQLLLGQHDIYLKKAACDEQTDADDRRDERLDLSADIEESPPSGSDDERREEDDVVKALKDDPQGPRHGRVVRPLRHVERYSVEYEE